MTGLFLLAALASKPVIAQQKILQLAEEALAAQFPADAHRLDVRVKRVEGAIGEQNGKIVFPADDRLPRGTTQVHLFTGSDAAGWRKTGWALLYVACYDSVVVLRRAVASGEALHGEDLDVAWMETTTYRGGLVRSADWRGLVAHDSVFATRSLRADRVLHQRDLRRAYAAETGETVRMQFRRGTIRFEVACKARERGHLGEAIRLYAPDTKTTYRARLTGPGTATWIETL